MKIGIAEPHYHACYLHAVIRIAETSGYEVQVFTTHKVWEETLSFSKAEIKAKISIFDHISELIEEISRASCELDLLIFTTIQILEWKNLKVVTYRHLQVIPKIQLSGC